jgi:cell division protein FtsI/penicillin-binding protein 2
MIPAGHTDLVLPAFAEEWGLPGITAVAVLMSWLVWRAIRIALNAPDEYGVFLGLGLALLIALEMLLISAGALGAIPLTGIASPFLSSGNSAMIANFLIFAIILAISARASDRAVSAPFARPVRAICVLLGAASLVLLGKVASVQAVHDEELLARDVMVYQADGVKRAQHNPRLNSLAQSLPRGHICDRNGVVLAESAAGMRRYPYARATAHLIGDLRTGENFAATNSSLIEDDQNATLRGYASYSELASLVRYRHQPDHPGIAALHARNRDVRTTVDIRLQERVVETLDRRLRALGRRNGAAVVMNASSGDVLALASAPGPPLDGRSSEPDALLDRARYGQYPPGSTFKLVTAVAALRRDPGLVRARYRCGALRGGRVGARIAGWNRPIRDDAGDPAHGSPDMTRALAVSCNAWFAQLGVFGSGAETLYETARMLDLPAGDSAQWKLMLPFAAMGQGPVLVTPFKLARISAAVASEGVMPQGRWLLGDANTRTDAPRRILDEGQARFLADSMRAVVTTGTGRSAMAGLDVQVAGKTGTAQTNGEAHSWFTGFAPYDAPPAERIAFAVVVEHGGYGARAAAPIAREIIVAARDLGIIAAR